MEDVEGDESTSNSSSEEYFATTQNEGLNEPQQDGLRERPQKQRKECLEPKVRCFLEKH